jgi:hypothetical protein
MIINKGVSQGNLNVVVDSSPFMLLFAVLAGIFLILNTIYAVLFAEGTANYLHTRAY